MNPRCPPSHMTFSFCLTLQAALFRRQEDPCKLGRKGRFLRVCIDGTLSLVMHPFSPSSLRWFAVDKRSLNEVCNQLVADEQSLPPFVFLLFSPFNLFSNSRFITSTRFFLLSSLRFRRRPLRWFCTRSADNVLHHQFSDSLRTTPRSFAVQDQSHVFAQKQCSMRTACFTTRMHQASKACHKSRPAGAQS